MPRLFPVSAAVLGFTLVFVACQIESPTAPIGEDPDLGRGHGGQGGHDRVKVCHSDRHRGWGWGKWKWRKKGHHYEEMWISSEHEGWHKSHGDGKVGDDYPDKHGHVFDRHCKPVKPKASLTVIKEANAAATFDFEGSPLLGEFQLTTGGEEGDNQITFEHLDSRIDFNILEVLQSGFTLVSAVCVKEGGEETGYPDERGVTDIRLRPGETTTCTFVNEPDVVAETGSLKFVKSANAQGEFSFEGSDPIGAFMLSTDGTTPAEQTFDGLDVSTVYAISEVEHPEFELVSATCTLDGGEVTGTSDATGVSDIAIESGKTTTCTFTNEQIVGSLRVVKTSDSPGTFNFTGSPTIGDFELSTTDPGTPEQTFVGLDSRVTYSITEASNPLFTLLDASCTLQGGESTGGDVDMGVTEIVIEPGMTTTCTFVNEEVPVEGMGSLNVTKFSDVSDEYQFEGSPLIGPFTLVSGDPENESATFDGLDPAQTYTITELVEAGTMLFNATCLLQDGTPTGMRVGNSLTGIVVEDGGTTSCSFINGTVSTTGSLRVVKSSNASGTFAFEGSSGIGAFSLSPTDVEPAEMTFDDLEAGSSYSITETVPEGFALDEASCTLSDDTPTGSLDGSTISGIEIQAGLTTTCTFVNSQVARLLVVVTSDAPGAFDFTGVPNIGTFTLTVDPPPSSQTVFVFTEDATTYTLTQAQAQGFDFQGAACVLDGTTTGTLTDMTISDIQVQLGATTTCTFENLTSPVGPPLRGVGN